MAGKAETRLDSSTFCSAPGVNRKVVSLMMVSDSGVNRILLAPE